MSRNVIQLFTLLRIMLSPSLFSCLRIRELTLNSNVSSDELLPPPPRVSLLFFSLPLGVFAVFLHQSIFAFPLSRPSFSRTHSVQNLSIRARESVAPNRRWVCSPKVGEGQERKKIEFLFVPPDSSSHSRRFRAAAPIGAASCWAAKWPPVNRPTARRSEI